MFLKCLTCIGVNLEEFTGIHQDPQAYAVKGNCTYLLSLRNRYIQCVDQTAVSGIEFVDLRQAADHTKQTRSQRAFTEPSHLSVRDINSDHSMRISIEGFEVGQEDEISAGCNASDGPISG